MSQLRHKGSGPARFGLAARRALPDRARAAVATPLVLTVLLALGACAPRALESASRAAQAGRPAARSMPSPETEPAAPTDYLYICVQDDARIAILDMATLEVVRTVDLTALGFSPNASPHDVEVAPSGSQWFVSLIHENQVVRFDADGALAGSYAMEAPGMLDYDAEADVLLASHSMSAVNPPARVSLIDASTMEGEDVDVFFPRPHPMVASADGRWAYTGSLGVNQLAAVEIESGAPTLTDVEGPAHALVQFALSPDGRTLVAATELSGRLLAFSLEDPAHPKQVASVDLGPMVFDPAFAPDGRSVWVPVKGTNEVAVVRTSDWSVAKRISAPSLLQPHAIVFSPDGTRAFVSNNNKADHMDEHGEHGAAMDGRGNVTVIDVATGQAVKVIELGRNVTGMGAAGSG